MLTKIDLPKLPLLAAALIVLGAGQRAHGQG
jgi:hypothetical protein